MTAEMYDLPPRRSIEPKRLYGISEIATELGVGRNWIHQHIRSGAGPQPEFEASAGRKAMMLWTLTGVDRWRAFHASELSIPSTTRFRSFSDHNAFNRYAGGGKGGLLITWKLWWQCSFDGGTRWWFSTPKGWYTSDDDGQTWSDTGLQVRPSDYRYQSVNCSVIPRPHVARILRSAAKLRRQIEGSDDEAE